MTPADYEFHTDPFQHQRDVFELSADREYWAYFLEPGLGKSKLLIDNMAYLYEKGEIKAGVITTVKAMCPSFEFVEIPTHMPARIEYMVLRYDSATVGSKAFKDKLNTFLEFDGLKILVVNVEATISEKFMAVMRKLFMKVKRNYIIGIDESTTIKTHTTKRSKAIVKISRAAKYKRIMTGTPVTNSPLEVFGQSLALGPPDKLLGHRSFYSFRNYFADVEKKTFGNRSFNVVTGYRNTSELTQVMGEWSSIIKKKDALDLPEKIYSKVIVEMTKKQEQMYNKLRDEAIIELEEMGDDVEVTNILTLLVKLHQVVCGQLKYEDDEGKHKYVSIENNRIKTLMELLELEDGKVVIWANYRQTLKDVSDTIRKEYGDDAVIEYHGGVNKSLKEVAAKRFQDKDDPSRFFIANPQSAGFGLTLTESDLAIYYSNGYSLEQRIQSEDRIDRIGQKSNARYIDLVTPETVDEKILKALRTKKNLADKVVVSNWQQLI